MGIKLFGAALVGALATGLVLASVAGAASAKPSSSSAVTTFHLIEVDQSFHFVDNPPRGS